MLLEDVLLKSEKNKFGVSLLFFSFQISVHPVV
jgi:hypothetical protein